MTQPIIKPLADGSPLSGDRIRRNDGEVYDAARRVGLESMSKPRAMYPVHFFVSDPPGDPTLAGNVGQSIIGCYWPDRPVHLVRYDLVIINPSPGPDWMDLEMYLYVGKAIEVGEGRLAAVRIVSFASLDQVLGVNVDTVLTNVALNERIGVDAVLRFEVSRATGSADWFLTLWFTEDHDG